MGVGRRCQGQSHLKDLKDRKLWEAGTGLRPASTWVYVEAGGTPSPRVAGLGVRPTCQTETPPSRAEDPLGLTSRSGQVAVEGNVSLAHGQEIRTNIWNDTRARRRVPAIGTLSPPCFCLERAASTVWLRKRAQRKLECLLCVLLPKLNTSAVRLFFNDPFFK